MANLYRLFRELIPEPPLLVGTITVAGTQSCQITLIDGGVLNARGAGTFSSPVRSEQGTPRPASRSRPSSASRRSGAR